MKENIKTIKKVVMDYLHGVQVMNIEETTLMIWDMDMEKCIGQMVLIIKGCGKRVFKVEKESY